MLLDALVCLFLATIASVAIYGALSTAIRLSAKLETSVSAILDERNTRVEEVLHHNE